MSILLFMIFGLIVGLLARAIMPGRQSMGLIMTAVLGMIGSFLGGVIGSLISDNSIYELHAAGFLGSLIGALIVLAITSLGGRKRGLV